MSPLILKARLNYRLLQAMIYLVLLVLMGLIIPITTTPMMYQEMDLSRPLISSLGSTSDERTFTSKQLETLDELTDHKPMNPPSYGFPDSYLGSHYLSDPSVATKLAKKVTGSLNSIRLTTTEKRYFPEGASIEEWKIYQHTSSLLLAQKIKPSKNLNHLADMVKSLKPNKFDPATGNLPPGVLASTWTKLIQLNLHCLEEDLQDKERLWALGVLSCLSQADEYDLVGNVKKSHFFSRGTMGLSYLESKYPLSKEDHTFMALIYDFAWLVDVRLAREVSGMYHHPKYQIRPCEFINCILLVHAFSRQCS